MRGPDGDRRRGLRRAAAARAARLPGQMGRAARDGGAMKEEEKLPTEAELREAELLRRALEEPAAPGRDLGPVDDALGAASLVRASREGALSELRARAVL